MINWHVLRVRGNSEVDVAEKCQELSFSTYCPRYRISYVVKGRRQERVLPVFQSYLFVNFDGANPYDWHKLNDMKGVVEILGRDDPNIVTEDEINVMRVFLGEGDFPVADLPKYLPFRVGDTIKLITGPFNGHTGVCAKISKDGMVDVKIALLARECIIALPANWCELADPELSISRSRAPNNRRNGRGSRRNMLNRSVQQSATQPINA